MTMQTEPVARQVGKPIRRGLRMFVCGVAVVLAVALVAARAAHAETAIAHTRPRAHRGLAAQTERARASSRSDKAGIAKPGARRSAAHSADTTSAHNTRKAAKKAAPELHGRLRSRRHPEPVEEPEPVVLHRAKGTRAREPKTLRVVARKMQRPGKTVSVSANHLAPAPDVAKTLTVDDFMRAAAPPADDVSTANGKVYVRGESRTEVDERISDQPAVIGMKPRPLALKPAARKPTAVVATVEANPAGALPASAPTSWPVDAPSEDLVGGPLLASADAPKAMAKTAIAPLPPLSRQEVTEEIEQPVVLPGLYRNGRLVVPAPLKGTHEILVHQNLMADDEGLERIEDDYDLRRLRAAHLLVDFPESASLHINPELAANRRCGRVWSVKFATNIARDFYAKFHQPLQVNSAVRTVAYQVRLQRVNGNAAGIDGDTASPHLTGQAMDLGKRNMSMAQIAWMRSYLLPLMQAGKVDVEEEFQQACFHISVYRTYMPAPVVRRAPRNEVAQLREPRVKSASRREDLR